LAYRDRAPKARDVKAWANGPGSRFISNRSAESAQSLAGAPHFALSALDDVFRRLTKADGLGYYIMRLGRFDLIAGLIYLTDTAAEQGVFTCVPGFHRRIEDWLNGLPPAANPRDEDLEALGAVPIPDRAGDLIIWHRALPHGSHPNRCARARIVQHLNMHPATREDCPEWK